MLDKITSIEQNIEKNNRRSEIVEQTICAIKQFKPKKLKCATLAGENWLFEHSLLNRIENEQLNINTKFYSAEWKRNIAVRAIKNSPQNSILVNNTFHYMLTREINENRVGIGSVNDTVRCDNAFNFMWADYCGVPNKQLFRNINNYIINMNGLFYVTFYLLPRQEGGFSGLCQSLNISEKNVSDSIIKRLTKKARQERRKVEVIYDVIYSGGKRSKMLTLGFAVGTWSNTRINIIQKDTTTPTKYKKQRYQTYHRYKNTPKLFDGRKNRTSSMAGTKTTNEQKDMIKKLIDKGVSNEVISNKLGLSRRCVGAVSAWYNNPHSFKKCVDNE